MAKPLNKNNFIRWTGEFNNAPAQVMAVNDTAAMATNESVKNIQILQNDLSTYGINANSVTILTQPVPGRPAIWDAAGKVLKFYAPQLVPGFNESGVYTLTYEWTDNAGNKSNVATVQVTVAARTTAWRGELTSYSCVQSGGFNTGMAEYGQLTKYYTDNGELVLPREYKANTFGDPDYIAPISDPAFCPVPAQGDDLVVRNFRATGSIVDIFLKRTGFPDVVLFASVAPNSTKTFKVQGGILYNNIVVRFGSSMFNASCQIIPGTGGSGSQTIDPVVGIVADFANVTLGSPDAGEITLS